MKKLIIFGLVLSSSAFIATVKDYFLSDLLAQSMVQTNSLDSTLNSKVADLIKSQCSGDVIQIVDGRLKAIDDMQELMLAHANSSVHMALFQGILWALITLIFVVMLIKSRGTNKQA